MFSFVIISSRPISVGDISLTMFILRAVDVEYKRTALSMVPRLQNGIGLVMRRV